MNNQNELTKMKPDIFVHRSKMHCCSGFPTSWWNWNMTIWLGTLGKMMRMHGRARRCLGGHDRLEADKQLPETVAQMNGI